jgi:hypothetical protein
VSFTAFVSVHVKTFEVNNVRGTGNYFRLEDHFSMPDPNPNLFTQDAPKEALAEAYGV